jgi:N-acetylmuramoyl-L-alanine amidase
MKAKLDLTAIVQDKLSPKEYFAEEFPKQQIYLHHTVSHPSPINSIQYWRQEPYRIGTAFLVAGKPYPADKHKDGAIYQCFSSKHWSYHLASHFSGNKIPNKYKTMEVTRKLEKGAVGIEICNAGWLTWENGKFYSSFRTVIPEDQVIEYVDKYRGQRFFHKYTDAQIEMTRQLLVFLCDTYKIPKDYQPDMWDISENCLSGKPGIFTHTSVRSDKTDCHPQPELVRMLMELSIPEVEEAPPVVTSASVGATVGTTETTTGNGN